MLSEAMPSASTANTSNALAPHSASPHTDAFHSHVSNGRPPKQRRNKPTLSCTECVERKTKCDRLRPHCMACVRRQSTCRYSQGGGQSSAVTPSPDHQKHRRSAERDQASRYNYANAANTPSPQESFHSFDSPSDFADVKPPRHPSVLEHEKPSQIDVFGIGSQHPFHNYWTRTGGLPEVIGVLPNKEHADVLVDKYFEVVDALYPIISRPEFTVEYDRFWSLSAEDKCKYDAAKLALHLVVYAMGTQYMHILELNKRIETAEFYISASHQALSLSSYLNHFSLSTLQTMVLTCYFLVSNNHVSDAWTFSGIIQRQAAVLGLNRDPDIITPHASFEEKQQRCKLWQAIMFQDTGLALYLKLPPTSLHYDVTPDKLLYPQMGPSNSGPDVHSRAGGLQKVYQPRESSSVNDIAYLRSLWEFTALVQNTVAIPKSLSQPLCKDIDSKNRLINQYREMHRSWPFPFSSCDPSRYSTPDPRLARQLITVSSSVFFVLMELYSDENETSGVTCDVFGALESAHQGMTAFFALARLFPGEVDVWLAYHTRAYVTATKVANLLAVQVKQPGTSPEPRFVAARDDLDAYLYILCRARGTQDYERLQRSRATALYAIRNSINVV